MIKKALMILALLFSFSACGAKETEPVYTAEELVRLIAQECDADAAVFSSRAETLSLLGLEEEQCLWAASFRAEDTVYPQTAVILRCASAEHMPQAEAALESLLAERLESSRKYSPPDYETASQIRVEKNGLWLALFLSSSHEAMEELYARALAGQELPALLPVTPSPAPTEEPRPDVIAVEGEAVPDNWFDGTLIVGDSIVQGLEIYVRYFKATGWDACMGEAVFFCTPNFSFALAVDQGEGMRYFPLYKHQPYKVEELISVLGSKKLMIGMGANELPANGAEVTVAYVETLMERCLEAAPELEIYLMNHPPCYTEEKERGIDNRKIMEYNEKLLELCREKGYHYLDIHSALAGEDGLLPAAYCRDKENAGVHLTESACRKWVEYLYSHCGSFDEAAS